VARRTEVTKVAFDQRVGEGGVRPGEVKIAEESAVRVSVMLLRGN
jgi:hypothetical protein